MVEGRGNEVFGAFAQELAAHGARAQQSSSCVST
jgi:hypothetical protein